MTIKPELLQNPDFDQDWQQANFATLTQAMSGQISQYVNGKGLACPMPLLKLKMALRDTAIGEHVYVTATDPNSQHDIGTFCQHTGHALVSVTHDTIIHLLITKNC